MIQKNAQKNKKKSKKMYFSFKFFVLQNICRNIFDCVEKQNNKKNSTKFPIKI